MEKGLKTNIKRMNNLLFDMGGMFAIENLKNLHHDRKRERGDI